MTRIEITAETFPQTDARVHHATKTKATKLAQMFAAEYPALGIAIAVETDLDAGQTSFEFATFHRGDADADLTRGQKVPDLSEVLEACEDAGVDPENAQIVEAETFSSSVVPDVYRRLYKEVSTTGQTCGDWLAEWLVVETTDFEGKFNDLDFEDVLSANGVGLTAKWAKVRETQTPGWRGRFRMNGRQALEKVVALAGKVLNAQGTDAEMPAHELEVLQVKHAKFIAKARKAEAAAKQSIVEAVEGTETEGA